MTKTIKILIVVLFLIAATVVVRVGFLISQNIDLATANVSTTTKVDYEDSDDFDNDGLSNADEAYWGSDPYNPDSDGDKYFDGEEVVSGHDPKKADADSIAGISHFNTISSTQRMAEIIAGGILSGELKPGITDSTTYNNSIADIADASIYSTLNALESVTIDEPVNLVPGDKAAQESYVGAFSKIIADQVLPIVYAQPREVAVLFVPNLESTDPNQLYLPEQSEKIKNTFLKHATEFQTAYDAIKVLPVPEGWQDIQKQTLTLLKKLELYYRDIALSTADYMRQFIVLGNLQNVYLESEPILKDIANRVRARGIKIPDDDFFNTNLILNAN